MQVEDHFLLNFCLFTLDFFFFFLAMLCLSCGMWGLQSLLQHAGSLFVACRI